jgi:hypothetical protein
MLKNKNWQLEDEELEELELEDEELENWFEQYDLDEDMFEDEDGWMDLRGCDLESCLDADDYDSYLYEHGFNGFYYDPSISKRRRYRDFEDDDMFDEDDDDLEDEEE